MYLQQVAPYVAPVATWGDYEVSSGGGSCANDPETCDTRFIFIHAPIIFIINMIMMDMIKKALLSGTPMMRSCSIPGACVGKYLSCRKWTMIIIYKCGIYIQTFCWAVNFTV